MSKSKSAENLIFSKDFQLSGFRINLKLDNSKSLTSESISLYTHHVKVHRSKVFSTPDSLAFPPSYSQILRFDSRFLRSITRRRKKPIFEILCCQLNNIEDLMDLNQFWLIPYTDKRIDSRWKSIDLLIYAITGIFKFSAGSKVPPPSPF